MSAERESLARHGAIIAIVCLLLGSIGWYAYSQTMKYRLMATEADLVPADVGLVHFAQGLAEPAYQKNCASCHGRTLQGNSRLGAPDLTDSDWLYGFGKVSQIEYTINYGIRSGNPKARNLAFMPSFAHPNDDKEKLAALTPGEIKNVIQYVFSLQERSTDTAAVQRGAAIYSDKGACYDCHARDGRGDHEVGAPNLADTVWLNGDGSPRSVFQSIAAGRAGVCPAWKDRLEPAVIRALAVFIHQKATISP